jgi:hypothetical protein
MRLKFIIAALAVTTFTGATSAKDIDAAKWLKDECARVFEVYPLLMLTVMAEGPMNCGEPGTDEVIDCDADLPAAEKEAKAKRLKVRMHQEAMYQKADAACTAYVADKKSSMKKEIAVQAINEARKVDSGTLPSSTTAEPPAAPASL